MPNNVVDFNLARAPRLLIEFMAHWRPLAVRGSSIIWNGLLKQVLGSRLLCDNKFCYCLGSSSLFFRIIIFAVIFATAFCHYFYHYLGSSSLFFKIQCKILNFYSQFNEQFVSLVSVTYHRKVEFGTFCPTDAEKRGGLE